MFWLPVSLLNALFESFSNLFAKKGAQKIDSLSAAWAQRFFSLLILIPLVFITGSLHTLNEHFLTALLITGILNTIASILFIKAVKDSPLSLTLPIITFTPVFLLITSPIMLNEFPKPLGIVGILSTVIGSYILNLDKKSHGILGPLVSIVKEEGSRFMLFAAFIWSITSNVDKIAVVNSNPIFYSLTSAILILFFLTIILFFRKVSIKNIILHAHSLAPIGIFSGIGVVFQMTAISMTLVPNVLSVKRTSVLFGTIWGKVFFKEENFKERLLGTTIMVLGVILITLA